MKNIRTKKYRAGEWEVQVLAHDGIWRRFGCITRRPTDLNMPRYHCFRLSGGGGVDSDTWLGSVNALRAMA